MPLDALIDDATIRARPVIAAVPRVVSYVVPKNFSARLTACGATTNAVAGVIFEFQWWRQEVLLATFFLQVGAASTSYWYDGNPLNLKSRDEIRVAVTTGQAGATLDAWISVDLVSHYRATRGPK